MSTRGRSLDALAVHGEFTLRAVPRGVHRIEERLAGVHHAGDAAVRRLERVHPRGVHLLRLAGVMDGVVENHQRPATAGFGIGGERDGVVEVDRAVRADRRGRTHRADEHDGLVAMHDERQEISRLLHRVGAVGDDDAVHVVLREQFVATVGELEPDLVVHRLAADVGDLFAGQHGDIGELRHGIDEVVHRERAGLVARVRLRGLRAGDGAAGGENLDVGQCPGSLGNRQRQV